jgi:hypothetical protein
MVRGFSTPAAGHELKRDDGIARDIFSEKGDLRPNAQVSRAPSLARLNDRKRLALKKRSLPEGLGRWRNHQHANSQADQHH